MALLTSVTPQARRRDDAHSRDVRLRVERPASHFTSTPPARLVAIPLRRRCNDDRLTVDSAGTVYHLTGNALRSRVPKARE
jgi:hypothetical protein